MDEEDKSQELQADLRGLQEERLKLSTLQDHAGYKYLTEIAEEQIKARRDNVVLVPLKNMDEVLEQEFKKGEIAGITLFKEFINVRLLDLSEQIEELLKEIEDGKKLDDSART